jgi:hypothetical protein
MERLYIIVSDMIESAYSGVLTIFLMRLAHYSWRSSENLVLPDNTVFAEQRLETSTATGGSPGSPFPTKLPRKEMLYQQRPFLTAERGLVEYTWGVLRCE